jgi:hypothetical protein
LETCQSGLMYLFAKEAGALSPLGGSNPPVSASIIFNENNFLEYKRD